MDADYANRTWGIVFGICFTLVPLVIAIYLFWSVVVGPEDIASNAERRKKKS